VSGACQPVGGVEHVERLGHATVSLTLDIYSHLLEQQHDDAAERIGDVLRGSR
jgi:integrase